MHSRCSRLDDRLKKSSLDSDVHVSKTELRKKKRNRYSDIQGSSTLATRILRSMKKTAVMILPSSSVELQNSEAACCHKYASVSPCDNNETLDLKAPKNTCEMEQYGLLKSSEINKVTDKNDYPSQTEEWEVAKIVDGRMRSRCSQFDDPLTKSSLDSDDQVSKTEHRKKRKNRYSKIQGSSTPATRILRSRSKTVVTVLPSSSPELQNSDVANCQKHALVSPCDNDGSLDFSERKKTSEMEHDGLLNSSEINFVIDGNNYSSQPEEREAAKVVDGRKRPGCSQLDDPLKKSSLDSDDQVSKSELHIKRENRYSEIQGSSTPATRILRSMTKTAAAVLPSSSLELQNSEVVSCHKHALVSPCDNDGSLDLSEPKNTSEMEQHGLLNSSEINIVTDRNNYTSQPEEWEAAKIVEGRTRSRCSQFVDPLNKSCLDSDDQVSKTELRKKRENRYSEIQGSSTPSTRILRSMTKTAAVLPSCSPELQNSEVASCHKYPLVSSCDNDGSLDLSNPKNTSEMEQDRLLNSSEINFVTDGNNYLSETEEWEVVKVVDGKERLGYSQFDDPHKKSSLDSDDQVSKTKLLKKRKNSYSEIQGSCGKPTTRMSRSMTKTAVLGRRSPRLISK
ncbi:uncharacterized protein [Medicago truncatula]|nr:uncharacterized protein LOC25492666 isoform X3 [Medicago truncatula]